MTGFLSSNVMTSRNNNRRPYTLDEDRAICDGLENGDSVSAIAASLTGNNFERSEFSVRHRIGVLRNAASKYDTLEDFHRSKE